MPTFRHGKATRVLLNATDMSAFLNEATATTEVETGETTTFVDEDKTYIVGLADGTISLSGLFDSTAGASDAVLRGTIGASSNQLTVAQGGFGSGSPAIVADAEITSYEVSSPVGDVVSLSADFQSSGGVLIGACLTGLAAVGASVQGTALDNSASTSSGLVANLHVTANDRDGAASVSVLHSQDNVTFTSVADFTVLTASSTGSETLEVGGNVLRYVRSQILLGGSSGSVTFLVSAARR